MRVQKWLANCGMASRRTIEDWIRKEWLTLDGKPIQLGACTFPKSLSRFAFKGKAFSATPVPTRTRVLIYHKPLGEICTRAQTNHQTVFSTLPAVEGRWIGIGRLDVNSSGLLLFTNDGSLAQRLMHPSYQVKRVYEVRVWGDRLSESALREAKLGITVSTNETLSFDEIKYLHGSNQHHQYQVSLHTGRYRAVRRLFQALGLVVTRLKRIQYGPIVLNRALPVGRYAECSKQEIEPLRSLRHPSARPVKDSHSSQ